MSYHYDRGVRDGEKDRAPLFRKVRGDLIEDCGDSNDCDWTPEQRQEYMRGYDNAQANQ